MIRARRTLVLIATLALAAPLALHAQPRTQAGRAGPPAGWLGLMYEPVGEGMVRVREVSPESPADRAGLAEGDTLVQWNGRTDVAAAMRERRLEPGDTVRVRVRRGGERDRELAVVAAERPAPLAGLRRRGEDGEVVVIVPEGLGRELRVLSDSLALRADSLHARIQILMRDSLGPRLREFEREVLPDLQIRLRELEGRFPGFDAAGVRMLGGRSVAGAEFAEVNEGLSAYFGTRDGALVLTVAPDTPAARAGLQPGDVVVRAGGEAVETIGDVRRAVARAQRGGSGVVELEVLRRGEPREMEMRWE